MGIRVELKEIPFHATYQEREIAFRKMQSAFKKAVDDSGLLREYRKYEHYESPSRKRKTKQKQNEINKMKARAKENMEKRRGENE